ncbi:MAG: hypothetical protein COA42_20315 [Alteromonadaceae bacterium]|nr:MAG: hypothetical protein COA42_20315 [Alteromonadaceae bacterium]
MLAESDATVTVGSAHYFPPSSLSREYFQESSHRSCCSWKGEAHYYSVIFDEQVNENAAWYYPEPKGAAKEFGGMVSFWKGVEIIG